MLEYIDFCEESISGWTDALDLTASESGESRITNPEHTGQLADRLRNAEDVGTDWVGGKGKNNSK